MKLPLSWIKDYVDITIAPEALAEKLTFAGLEVEQIDYLGVPAPHNAHASGEQPFLTWERDKIFIGKIIKIEPHPNADRLTLATVEYGASEPIVVVTGAPNIHVGESGHTVALALEGARLFDGHAAGWKLMTLKKSKIRGVESGSMVCSEKELGISDEHEGIILLPDDAPVGAPLVDYLGDVVFDIKLNPNMARCASVVGIAREVAALTGKALRPVPQQVVAQGAPIAGQVEIVIGEPKLNPRFTVALLKNATIQPSPFWLQRRLRMAGMRPINNIVDVTNYVMLEVGQALHAFDYDKLVGRARSGQARGGQARGGQARGIAPTIITRLAKPGEELETLDGVKRQLDPFTILVCDTQGALSLGGVMGGAQTEVDANTKNVLLEGASWEFINIRQTMAAQHLASEASYRFSRGVHPAQAKIGLLRGIELMRELSGGQVAKGIVDQYPNKPKKIVIAFPVSEVKRQLGVELATKQIVKYLEALEFKVENVKRKTKKMVGGQRSAVLRVTCPDHRLDIAGAHDLIEEIARLYGYENIPIARMNDELPPQHANVELEQEERARDLLIDAGLQDIITYRFTTPAREQALTLPGSPHPAIPARAYVRIENPISAERAVLRQTLIAHLLDHAAANLRYRSRIAAFEIGPVFYPRGEDDALLPREAASELPEDQGLKLPLERRRLGIVLTGPREQEAWHGSDTLPMDFYDLKGVVETLLDGLHRAPVTFAKSDNPLFHPGRAASLQSEGQAIGVFGELHPSLHPPFDLPAQAVLVGEFDFEALFARVTTSYQVAALSRYPGVAQDLALIVDENMPADKVRALIAQTGGALLARAMLFDVYRGDQIPPGKKSLAYALTFQAADRTLSDAEATKVREKIIARIKREIDAQVRGG